MTEAKFTMTVECPHYAYRKWWVMGTFGPDVTVFLHGCDGCAALAERAGISVELIPDRKDS